MHGVGARAPGGVQDALDVEVALARRGRAEQRALIRLAHVQGVAVRFGVDRHGGEAGATTRAEHAARDLAAIGDEDGAHARVRGRRA